MTGKPKKAVAAKSRNVETDARARLKLVADATDLTADLLAVTDPRSNPSVLSAPIDSDLAKSLVSRCTSMAQEAAQSELRQAAPGFRQDSHQRAFMLLTSQLQLVDDLVKVKTQPLMGTATKLGARNLLVVRVFDGSGKAVARFYQALPSENDLQIRRRQVLVWEGGQFTQIPTRPLLLTEHLQLVVLDDVAVMASSSAYERLFGPLPDLAAQSQKTYSATLGKLKIENGAELAHACATDINMMRKLLSIQRKLDRPGYAAKITHKSLLAYIQAHTELGIDIKGSGNAAKIVFESDVQHRWRLLKLLDDDNLLSELTGFRYESNSKIDKG